MTGEQYIYKRHSNYVVIKKIGDKTQSFGFFKSLEDAIFARELLIKYDWNMDEIKKLGNVIEHDNRFLIVSIYKDKLRFLERFDDYDEAVENSERIIRNFEENPHNSRYGTYIYESNGIFYIRKSIDNEEVWFGIYRNLDDATFARNLLKDNDWNLDRIKELAPVCFSEVHGKYAAFDVVNDRLVVADKFDSQNEALEKAQKSIEKYSKGKYKTGEKNVAFNGKLFAVQRGVSGKVFYYGSFREIEDAVAVRDLLISIDWDLSAVYENKIYEFNGHFYKFHIFESRVKIIGKFESYDDAVNNQNNLSDLTYEDIYNPENQYSKVNKYIVKRGDQFWIKRKIDGQHLVLGPYGTRSQAVDARDRYEENGWDMNLDDESIYSTKQYYDDSLDEVVSNLTLWQKIIYDTIVRLDKTYFAFDELLDHSYLKRYRSGKNFEQKVRKHLGDLVDLGIVTQLEVNIFRKEF